MKKNTTTLKRHEKMTTVLSYLGILVFIPFFITKGKRTPFILFHLKQGIALLIAVVLWWFVSTFIWFMSLFIPIGGIMRYCLYTIHIIILIIAIYCIYRALKGDKWMIPFLGEQSKKFSFR